MLTLRQDGWRKVLHGHDDDRRGRPDDGGRHHAGRSDSQFGGQRHRRGELIAGADSSADCRLATDVKAICLTSPTKPSAKTGRPRHRDADRHQRARGGRRCSTPAGCSRSASAQTKAKAPAAARAGGVKGRRHLHLLLPARRPAPLRRAAARGRSTSSSGRAPTRRLAFVAPRGPGQGRRRHQPGRRHGPFTRRCSTSCPSAWSAPARRAASSKTCSRRIADFTEHQEDLKAKVVGSMAYPVFLGRRRLHRPERAGHLLRAEVRADLREARRPRANCPA